MNDLEYLEGEIHEHDLRHLINSTTILYLEHESIAIPGNCLCDSIGGLRIAMRCWIRTGCWSTANAVSTNPHVYISDQRNYTHSEKAGRHPGGDQCKGNGTTQLTCVSQERVTLEVLCTHNNS